MKINLILSHILITNYDDAVETNKPFSRFGMDYVAKILMDLGMAKWPKMAMVDLFTMGDMFYTLLYTHTLICSWLILLKLFYVKKLLPDSIDDFV